MQLSMRAKAYLMGKSYKLSTTTRLHSESHISGKVTRGKLKVPLFNIVMVTLITQVIPRINWENVQGNMGTLIFS